MGERETVNREKLFSRDFAFICAVNFLAFFSIYLIIPILPTFLEEKGYSNFLIGALMSMLLIPTLLRPFLGRMSDTRGRKSLLVWGHPAALRRQFLLRRLRFRGASLRGPLHQRHRPRRLSYRRFRPHQRPLPSLPAPAGHRHLLHLHRRDHRHSAGGGEVDAGGLGL